MQYHKLPEFDINIRAGRYLEYGYIIAILLLIIVFVSSKEIKVEVKQHQVEIKTFDVEKVEQTIQEKVAPPPALPTVPIASEDEDLPDDVDIVIGDEFDFEDFTPPPPPMLDQPVDFFSVEEPPELIGGTTALYKYVKYPEMAKIAGVEGVAQITFTVDKNGVPRDFVVSGVRPPNLGFEDAAIKALQKVRFKPGYQRDRPVPVRMSQTVHFKME